MICLFLLIIGTLNIVKAQDDHIDVALFYSTMQANNSFDLHGKVDRWHGMGLNLDYVFFTTNKTDIFFGTDFLLGWANNTSNNPFDIGFKIGLNVNALNKEPYSLKVIPHISAGIMWNIISISDAGNYYNGDFYQLGMYVPVGVKILYHNFFVDIYYRTELLRSNLRELHDEDWDDIYTVIDILSKRATTNNRDYSVKTFSLFFALGYRF